MAKPFSRLSRSLDVEEAAYPQRCQSRPRECQTRLAQLQSHHSTRCLMATTEPSYCAIDGLQGWTDTSNTLAAIDMDLLNQSFPDHAIHSIVTLSQI